jgi:hypothetical protein
MLPRGTLPRVSRPHSYPSRRSHGRAAYLVTLAQAPFGEQPGTFA